METRNEKIPTPKELEKEIGEFLSKKFGGNIKISTPLVIPQAATAETDQGEAPNKKKTKINFDLKPEQLVSFLDQFIIKQDSAKAILSTKICTHFNRIKRYLESPEDINDMVGSIKNNVLMIGPTGVGKTYMVRLIAKKIGVPFVKGDATKFSETGYVGGDVEDLVRDLVREADGDIDRAQYGIIYIDEIDKIASSRNLVGIDVSRTGVQRGLLKPLEETEVDLKVPHDPISMLQEVENFRKTGKREKSTINTKNILFIMSGAFSELNDIISKRMQDQGIGFGAKISKPDEKADLLKQVRSEDLINYGFESEFVGRIPVRAVFESLDENDLYEILKNPNNPIILGKKLDFAAYGIDVKFADEALKLLAQDADLENTGARGLVSAVERAVLLFEKKLPSTDIKRFPVTTDVIEDPKNSIKALLNPTNDAKMTSAFDKLNGEESDLIKAYVESNLQNLADKYDLTLTPSRIDIVAAYYGKHPTDIDKVIKRIKSYYDEVKTIELYFLKDHDINIILEDDAIDFILSQFVNLGAKFGEVYKQLATDFELGLKLVQEKTGRNRFFLSRDALISPESYISSLLKNGLTPSE